MGMMHRTACSLILLLAAFEPVHAAGTKASYPAMAPLAQYLIANSSEEIALARSAAPPSISDDAEVLTLTSHGYESAAKGKNGFVCLVERSWEKDFDDSEFWNYHMRAPICLNPAAVRTVLPATLERASWALAGLSKDEIQTRTKASRIANTAPEPGAMSYMMSKQGNLSDEGGHWHPHVMFWLYRTDMATWGANLPGSPVIAVTGGTVPVTTFMVPVSKWSDGTPAMAMHQ